MGLTNSLITQGQHQKHHKPRMMCTDHMFFVWIGLFVITAEISKVEAFQAERWCNTSTQ